MGRAADDPAPVAERRRPTGSAGRERAVRRSQTALIGALALALAVIGALTYVRVRDHILDSVGDQLMTVQNTQEAAIRLWQQNEIDSVRGWAYEPDLRAAVMELTDDDGGRSSSDSDARRRIRDGLAGLLTAEEAIAYLVSDRGGRIVAASEERIVGGGLAPGGARLLRQVLAGAATVTTPVIISETFYEDLELPRRPIVIKAAPVHDERGGVVAALIVGVHPDEFGDLVDLGRFGATGETYAVDPRGWMLSRTRKIELLRGLGLAPPDAGDTSVYAFQVRDPGGDMSRGFRPGLPATGLPLTRAAAAVTDGESGVALAPYRDFVGVPVMGAWRWLDDLQLGLITEIDRREAMAPLRPLVVMFGGLFGIAALAAAGLLVYARIVKRLRRRIDEVTQLGEYTLVEKIGEGGMGKVYRARHSLLARDTAVKLLRPDVVTEDAIRRFEQEVQLTARLRHPNTVQIYDFGRTPEGLFYCAMEYLDGYDLARLIALNGPLAPDRVVHILCQAARSLREAHGAGLIHRDIKPMNLIVSAFGGEYDFVKLLDFGLVKDLRVSDPGMTELNMIPGTPPYIAPERLTPGSAIDGRVDIYGLGAVAFNLLTGTDVFAGESSLDVAYQTLHETPRAPSAVAAQTIPPALDALVLEMLARDPGARPADVQALLGRLERIAEAVPWDLARAAAWWAAHPPAANRDAGEATVLRIQGVPRPARP